MTLGTLTSILRQHVCHCTSAITNYLNTNTVIKNVLHVEVVCYYPTMTLAVVSNSPYTRMQGFHITTDKNHFLPHPPQLIINNHNISHLIILTAMSGHKLVLLIFLYIYFFFTFHTLWAVLDETDPNSCLSISRCFCKTTLSHKKSLNRNTVASSTVSLLCSPPTNTYYTHQ